MLRLSNGLVKKMVDTGSLRSILNGGQLAIFAGAQPADANTAPSSSPLLIMGFMAPPVQSALVGSGTGGSLAAATYYYKVTALNAAGETLASNEQSVVTTGTTSSVAVSWAAVPGATSYRVYRGTSSGSEGTYYTVTNGVTFTDTGAAGTAGSPPGSNTTGLTFSTDGTGGILQMVAGQTWAGVIQAAGTAGWFRFCEAADNPSNASTSYARLDGAVGTSGAEMNLANVTFVQNAPFSITGAAFTLPQS